MTDTGTKFEEQGEGPASHTAPAGASEAGTDLQALSDAATQGVWYTEIESIGGEYGAGPNAPGDYDAFLVCAEGTEPWNRVLFDSLNSTESEIEEEHYEDGSRAWDRIAAANAAYIVALVNAHREGRLVERASADPFQVRVKPWLFACFGEEIANDRIERNHRFLEEALELVQANGCTRSEAHQLVDYVFDRPVGELNQEAGGVMVTLAALCLASGINMHEAGETELARIWTKVDAIRAKQAAKPKHWPLPQHVELGQPVVTDAMVDRAQLAFLGAFLRGVGNLAAMRAALAAALEGRMTPAPDVPMPTEGEGE